MSIQYRFNLQDLSLDEFNTIMEALRYVVESEFDALDETELLVKLEAEFDRQQEDQILAARSKV